MFAQNLRLSDETYFEISPPRQNVVLISMLTTAFRDKYMLVHVQEQFKQKKTILRLPSWIYKFPGPWVVGWCACVCACVCVLWCVVLGCALCGLCVCVCVCVCACVCVLWCGGGGGGGGGGGVGVGG